MSDPNFTDAKFNRYFGAMIIAMIVLTALLMLLANAASQDVKQRKSEEHAIAKTDALAETIAPVGKLNIGAANTAPIVQVKAEPKSGDAVYKGACAACHGAGVAGAPRVGDANEWNTRITKGIETLYTSAISGVSGSAGYMPAKGGNPNLSDTEVKAAVDYMVKASK